jgi:transcriptional regulator with XRE-family HTH domain/desulfoferrodoxin (superoxide reductase-like protein)
MDCRKTGKLIAQLRKERGMTQKQLADVLFVSDKAVSKWETGAGCPDVTLLSALSRILGVNTAAILNGDLEPNDTNGDNMKKISFYLCPDCANILSATGQAEISCCGRKLEPLTPQTADEPHAAHIEKSDTDYYVTFNHEMSKTHYLTFAAYVRWDTLTLVKLYPEQDAAVRIPQMPGGTLYVACNTHGLFTQPL